MSEYFTMFFTIISLFKVFSNVIIKDEQERTVSRKCSARETERIVYGGDNT